MDFPPGLLTAKKPTIKEVTDEQQTGFAETSSGAPPSWQRSTCALERARMPTVPADDRRALERRTGRISSTRRRRSARSRRDPARHDGILEARGYKEYGPTRINPQRRRWRALSHRGIGSTALGRAHCACRPASAIVRPAACRPLSRLLRCMVPIARASHLPCYECRREAGPMERPLTPHLRPRRASDRSARRRSLTCTNGEAQAAAGAHRRRACVAMECSSRQARLIVVSWSVHRIVLVGRGSAATGC